jgi:carboxynorspermidine decarboxylase
MKPRLTPQQLDTPAYVVDYAALQRNLAILSDIKARTGCRILLALKAFSMFDAFSLLNRGLDGCCASSLHEARLAREQFGGEVHVFAAALGATDMDALLDVANHATFNSFAQWEQFRQIAARRPHPPIACGLRINPEHSEGHTPLYDPCAPGSRLGIRRAALDGQNLDGLTGLHVHNLCEHNADAFARTLAAVEARFGDLLPRFAWFNFGGGHHITRDDYDRDLLCKTIKTFRQRHGQPVVYLEPGEAVALNAGTLVTTVLDIVHNTLPIAILDTSCTCHMPDVLEMPYRPRVFRDAGWDGRAAPDPQAERGAEPGTQPHTFRLAGPSCLAGDVIGDYSFDTPLRTGDRLVFEDMAIYTMVKNTTFNGIRLPDIVARESDGTLRLVRRFGYDDFKMRLS